MSDRIRREETFSIVPHWLLDAGVSPGAIQVWCVLWRHADKDGRNAYPSHSKVAAAVGKSRATVKRWITELIDVGAVTVEQRRAAEGDPDSNLYTLHINPPNTRAGGRFTHDPTLPTSEQGVGSPVSRGGVTDEPRGRVTSEPQPIPLGPIHPSSSSSSVGNAGGHVRPRSGGGGIGDAFTDDPEAFDAVVRWCKTIGVPLHESTLHAWLPQARAFLAAGGHPTDSFLEEAHRAGIRMPAGWLRVPGAIPPTIWTPPDCDRCGNRSVLAYTHRGDLVPVDHPDAGDETDLCPDCRPALAGAHR